MCLIYDNIIIIYNGKNYYFLVWFIFFFLFIIKIIKCMYSVVKNKILEWNKIKSGQVKIESRVRSLDCKTIRRYLVHQPTSDKVVGVRCKV